jgi:hypothetical protein
MTSILETAKQVVALDQKQFTTKDPYSHYYQQGENRQNGKVALAAALVEADGVIREMLIATGYDKADRKALQNEYMAGGKGAGTILSALNFLSRISKEQDNG